MLTRLMRFRSASMVLVVTCFVAVCDGSDGRAVAKDHDCPEIGSTYQPNPEDYDKRYLYRLRIEGRSIADDPTQSTEAWQFQMLERSSGKSLVAFRLMESCLIGGLCSIRLPTGDRTGDVYSGIVRLTTGFRQTDRSVCP